MHSHWFFSMVMGFIWIAPTFADGATYYVAKTGSNNYSCSQAQSVSTPKLTIAGGIACLAAGDILTIRAGTYGEGIEKATIPSGISTSAPTILKAGPGEIVIINGSNSLGDALSIYDRSYIVIDHLLFDGYRVRIGGDGPAYSHYITVRNSIIKNTNKAGYPDGSQSCATNQGPAGANSHIDYINNEVYNCGPDTGHGIYVSSRASLLEGNKIHSNGGMGIHQYQSGATSGGSNNNVFRNNFIYNNGSSGILTGTGADNQVYGNIVRHNAKKNSAGGIRIGNNVASNIQVYHNTIYANTGPCINVDSKSLNSKVKNNFCLSNTSNLITNAGMGTIIANNRLSTNLSLVIDTANNLFTPRAGSALIDAGEIISGFTGIIFSGAAPDQGALEFVSATAILSAPAYLKVAP